MNRLFTKLFESNYSRFTNGGFLVGDIVVFKPDAIKHQDFESNEEMKFKIKSLINGGYNLRVVNIKNNFPVSMGGNNDNNIVRRNALVDVAQEIAPSRYHNVVTVPIEVLSIVSGTRPEKDQSPEHYNETQPDINLPEVRDKLIRKNRINIKPVTPENPSEDNEFNVGYQTLKSNVDGKNTAGDRSLKNTNIKIPASPNVTQKDPGSYTAQYLPKNN